MRREKRERQTEREKERDKHTRREKGRKTNTLSRAAEDW